MNPAAAIGETSVTIKPPNFMITQLDEVPPTRCPCGFARRGFATPDN